MTSIINCSMKHDHKQQRKSTTLLDKVRMKLDLNFGAVKEFLHFLETDNVLIDILADLKAAVEAMTRWTVLAEALLTVNAEKILLALPQVLVNETRTKEFLVQKRAKPMRRWPFHDDYLATLLSSKLFHQQQISRFPENHGPFKCVINYNSTINSMTWSPSSSKPTKNIPKVQKMLKVELKKNTTA